MAPPANPSSYGSDFDGELEPLLDSKGASFTPIARQSIATGGGSQVALVGANVCPIESLDYELIENEFLQQDWHSRGPSHIIRYISFKWILCLFVGAFTGLLGFLANLSIENVAGLKFVITSNLMLKEKHGWALVVFTVTNFVLTLFAAILTTFIAPAAAGSGIPEVKAYLNGVNAPKIFCFRTLVVKIIGCIAAVSSSLHVGKAGPLVHAGACVASILGEGGPNGFLHSYSLFRNFNNDRNQRELVTCGAAAGIAAAFRAPVAGLLFALEAVSSWWTSALLWRTFFTTAVVAVVLRALIDVCNSGKCGLFGKGGLIMYDVTADYTAYHIGDLPPVIILGLLGGVLGSLYNLLLEKVLRIYNLINEKGNLPKLVLAASLSLFTSFCLFGLPWLASCRPCPPNLQEACPTIGRSGNFKKFQCRPDQYNDLASLFFNTNDDTIRNLYGAGHDEEFKLSTILLFFVSSYCLGIISYGIVAPSGLFVPVILTGAAYGRLVGMLFGSYSQLDNGLFAVLGSAAMLGGSMRMTVSVGVMLLELTNNLLLLPLVMMVLLLSKTVADSLNSNVYDMLVKLKGFPYLKPRAEPYMRQLTVGDIVTGPLRTFNGIQKVGDIVHFLRTTSHNGFPVIDTRPGSEAPVLYGLILRSHLLALLKKKAFLEHPAAANLSQQLPLNELNEFTEYRPGKEDKIKDIQLSSEELEMYADLRPFTNRSPYAVLETTSVAKALILFHNIGLRHLLVVPNSCTDYPVVGILTRHDFMDERILYKHPSLMRCRWKRLRLGKLACSSFLQGL